MKKNHLILFYTKCSAWFSMLYSVLFASLYSVLLSSHSFAQEENVFNSSKKYHQTSDTEINILSLSRAIRLAQKNDPWLVGNQHNQQAVESMSMMANVLPDPKVSISLANLGLSSFDFAQEAMTQMKVSVAQMFPRGDSLAIKQQQLQLQSEQFPFQRRNRQGQVAVTVGLLWFDIYRVQQSIALIENNRSLFEQLADVAQASYSSAVGKTRQQDLVRAQLELTRLEDKLFLLQQQQSHYLGKLLPWLDLSADISKFSGLSLDDDFPEIASQLPKGLHLKKGEGIDNNQTLLVQLLQQHPSMMALDKKVQATKKGIHLAHQQYQPAWGVNASYGYRADDAMGNSRSDLLSLGVSFELPLFNQRRQDYGVKAAISKTEAVKTEKLLLLRQLISAYHSHQGRLAQLNKRKVLFEQTLLPQIHDQAEASLTAYTNDDGDFSEVVRARIAELNAQIDQLTINVEQQKIMLELNYLFIHNSQPISSAASGAK
jgi:outer membrane protein TolC